MTFAIGGTGSVKPAKKPRPRKWVHVCRTRRSALPLRTELPGYRTRCPGCGARRP